jgi:hypothetical protein
VHGIDDVCNLHAHAFLDNLCQFLRFGETFKFKRANVLGERSELALKGRRQFTQRSIGRVEICDGTTAVRMADNENWDMVPVVQSNGGVG